MAATVKLSAMWLLPVPGGPSSKSPPCSGIERTVPRSRMSAFGICGLNDQVEALQRLELRHSGHLQPACKGPIAARYDAANKDEVVAVIGTDRIRLAPGSGDEASILVADGSGQDRIGLLIQNHPSGVADTGIAIRSASGMTTMRLGNVAQ